VISHPAKRKNPPEERAVTTYVSVQGESCARLADLYESFRLKDEALKFAGLQLGGYYAVYYRDKKIWPVQ
jgi:hypothetical protein